MNAYIGDKRDSWAAWNDYFISGITHVVLDKYFDESINDHRAPYMPKFDNYYWNFYRVADVKALAEELEQRLDEEKNIDFRVFAEEFCYCMKELLGRSKGFDYILFKGP